MDWRARVAELQKWGSFQAALQFLDDVAGEADAAEDRADVLSARAVLLDDIFLQRIAAADLFVEVYDLDPERAGDLRRARFIHRSLGLLGAVSQSLERELATVDDSVLAADMFKELGDVQQDMGDDDAAISAYDAALSNVDGHEGAVAAREDVQARDEAAMDRMRELAQAGASAEGHAAAAFLVRAARVAGRLGDAGYRAYLEAALRAVPLAVEPNFLLDNSYAATGELEALLATHIRLLESIDDAQQRAMVATDMAARWLNRFQDSDSAAQLLKQAAAADPSALAPHVALGEYFATREAWSDALEMVEGALAELNGRSEQTETWLLSEATELAWRKLGDTERAVAYAERLEARAPDHPRVEEFRKEHEGSDDATEEVEAPVHEEASAADSPAETPAEDDPTLEEPLAPAEAAPPAQPSAPPSEPAGPPRELTADEQAKVAEIDEKLSKFESQKRWSDFARTLLAKAEILTDPAQQVEVFCEAGSLYADRLSNQGEAIKCFEKVLDLDSRHLEAITRLKAICEKRRDWERLLRVMKVEAELLDPDDKPLRYLEMAQLASQRLRKPELCIDLWSSVLEYDPENPEALSALVTLYERARQWEPLATVLEKRIDQIGDEAELKQQVQKLGMIYADKIGDDEGAVRTFQRLLELDPNDRRAQEQLKRRYVALKEWEKLEDFYATTEKWDELIRVYEREAEGADTTPEARRELLLRAAQLWETRKGKPERAARAYEKILADDPDNVQAAEALTPIYEKGRDPKKLIHVYEVRLKRAEEPQERITLLRELGLLYEEKLRDPGAAFERFVEAFITDPSQEVLREDVDRLAAETDGWSKVIDAYKDAIEKAEYEGDRVELQMSLGTALRNLGQTDDAVVQFRSVYDARNDHVGAVAALGELYRETKQYKQLMEVYESRLELENDAEVRRDLAYQSASLWETELGDADKAIDGYQRIVEEHGDGESAAHEALDRLYEQQGRWTDIADSIERRVELGPASHEELANLKLKLATVFHHHLDDKLRAVDLYREVLTIMPEHDEGLAAIESLLEDADVGVIVADILEPMYEVRANWEGLVRALLVLHAGSEDGARRIDLLTKIGEVYAERIGDPAKSFDAFCNAFREAPDSSDTLGRLELLAIEQERFAELVSLLKELAAAATDPSLSRELWLKAAQSSESQLNDVDGAVEAYDKILDDDPGDLDVLAALEALYRRVERWSDLRSVLRRRAEVATDPSEKEELLAQIAFLQDEMLESPDEAIRVYKEMLDLDPTSQRAMSALDDLYARQGLFSELADNMDRQLELAEDPDQQIAIMLRLAELRETQMEQVETAIEGYREVLDRDPTNDAAIGALERLLDNEAHQLQIAEILEPLYQGSSEFRKLIAIYEIQARHASAPDRRVELLQRVAELYEVTLDDVSSAFQCYARAIVEDPYNDATQDNLARLAAMSGSYEALAKVYEERVSDVQDPSLAAALHIKAAIVREEQLGDLESAIAHYQKVLELDDRNAEAAGALERLYQLSERYEELAGIYMAKAAMLDLPEDQKDYLFRAAAIYEEILERPMDAVAVYDRVLEVDAEDVQALDKLVELYLRTEQWPELLEVYKRKADVVYDPEEKKRILVETGTVYEREVGDVDKAIDSYQRVLEIDPDDMTAIARLDALYQASENWAELMSILEREADIAGDPHEVISYRYRIAELWHSRLDDAVRAVDIYRDILDVMPDHEPTLNALESMVSEGKEPIAASEVLEPVYRQIGEWAKLISVYEVQVAHEQDPVRQVELLHQIAELHEFQLDQPRQALDAYARSLAFDNENEKTLGSLERLAEQLGGWEEVTHLFDGVTAELRDSDPERMVQMALRSAQIHEVQVGDVEAAIERYRIVIEADPIHAQAIEALDRLYEGAERWAELGEILQKQIEVTVDPGQVLNFQFRLAQIRQEQLGDVEGAIEQYRDILAAEPDHSPSIASLELLFADGVQPLAVGEILEPLYRMQEAWDRLVTVYEVRLNYQSDPIERVSMMQRIAEVAEEKAADHVRAFAWMQRALLEDPSHDHVLGEVERLSTLLDGWSQLANTYADALDNAAHPAEARVEVGRRLARTYSEELGDVQRAEETYRYVLGVDGKDEFALQALDQMYTEYGAHEALAEVLKRRVAAAETPDEQVDFNYRLGQVLELDLARTEEAIEVYNRVLADLEPEHSESIQALQRIYTNRDDWPNLFGAFDKELAIVSGDSAQSDIYARMASIANDRLGDPDRSIELWRRVLDLRGEDPEALNALGDIYAAQENWQDLVDVLEREVSVVEDDQMRIAIYADLGRIWYERLQRDRNALDSWERVLDIDPGSTSALFAIAEIHRAAKQHHELVDALTRAIEVGAATLDDAVIENVYMQLGYLYSAELQQPLDAVDAYNRVLDVNPANTDALDALEAIHRAEGMWEDCVQVFERRVLVYEDPEQKRALLLAIAAMWAEELADADGGTSAYQRIAELFPEDLEAFAKVEGLHREAQRWEDLVEMYLGAYETSEDLAQRTALLRKIAGVYEEHLDDKQQAYEALKVAWMQDFSDKETAAELERVAGKVNAWNDLLNSANEALGQAEDPQTKINICLHCAKWYGQELGHPEYAIPYYEQILALDPTSVPALRSMADLYRSTQQWQTLWELLGRMVTMTDDPKEKAETYVQMGDLCEQQLGNTEQASSTYQQALALDPRHVGALEALEHIFEAAEQWHEFLDVLRRKADALTEPEEVLSAKLQIAEAYEDRLLDADEAIATYRQVIDSDATNLQALKGLERLLAQKEAWQDLLQVLEAQVDVVPTEKDRITVLVRLASMWEEEFVKPDNAAQRLEQVVEIDAQHEEALGGLARLYRQLQKWDSLVETYERHVVATPDRAEKARLHRALGDTYAHELDDTDRAVDAYLSALDINDNDVEALDALTRQYDKRGDHAAALEMMEKTAAISTDPTQQVDLRSRMGRILDEELGDRASAMDNFQIAVDLDPAHLPSLAALRRIYVDTGDWLAASKTLEQEAQYEENTRIKAQRLVQLGQICAERLDERDRSLEMFEAAQELDEDNEEAALPLADEYATREEWDKAFPLLLMLVKRGTEREPDEQHRLAFMLGEVSGHVGNDEEAIKAFSQAYKLDANHLPSLLGLAASYYRVKDWEKAFKFYQMLLVHHRDSLGGDETTDIFYRLGVIKREQGERRKALNMFDKALEEDGYHRPTLEAVVELYRAQNEWEQVIHFKRQILEVADNDDERFDLLDEIGDLWKEKARNQQKAIQAYSDAADVKPEDHKILHKLLISYQESKQWDRAVETIQRIADLDDRPQAKSKYAYTIGVIYRDELKDPETAAERFSEALDLDHGQLKAFEAINKIHTQKKDWKQLERAFRQMLHRIVGEGNTDLEYNLWHNLGVIYRDRQERFENAAEAFKMASNLKPDDPQEHQILAELFAMVPERVDDSIEEHQWLLRNDPYKVDSYRALYRLYFDARAYDKAWCLASTLTFLKKADAEQKQFFEQYKKGGMIQPQARIDNERWIKELFHPDEDIYVGKMLEAVVPAVHALKSSTDKALHLAKKHEVDPADSKAVFARTFGFVGQVLNLTIRPRLFLRPDAAGGLVFVPGSNPPASVCGATLLRGFTPQDLVFVVGRHLAYFRPEHFVRTLMNSHSELRAILLGAMRLAEVAPADPQIDQTAKQLSSKLAPAQADQLRKVGRHFVKAGAVADVKKWMQAVELTACRAGFLVSNDLETAARMIQSLPPEGATDVPPKEKIKEVVLFSVSEQYFRLREALGIQIQV